MEHGVARRPIWQQQVQVQVIGEFWRRRQEDIEATVRFNEHAIPMARLKKLICAEKGTMMMTFDTPAFLSKACELFVQELALRAWMCAESHSRCIILDSDIAQAVASTDSYDFLLDILRAHTRTSSSSSSSLSLPHPPSCNPPTPTPTRIRKRPRPTIRDTSSCCHLPHTPPMHMSMPSSSFPLLLAQDSAGCNNNAYAGVNFNAMAPPLLGQLPNVHNPPLPLHYLSCQPLPVAHTTIVAPTIQFNHTLHATGTSNNGNDAPHGLDDAQPRQQSHEKGTNTDHHENAVATSEGENRHIISWGEDDESLMDKLLEEVQLIAADASPSTDLLPLIGTIPDVEEFFHLLDSGFSNPSTSTGSN